jgi:serine/threonine-protein kinase RsbW
MMKFKDLDDLKVIKKSEIRATSQLSELAKVLAWFEQFNHPPVPRYIWLQCQLAIAEGFTNAVRHAHKNQPAELPIKIEVTVFAQHLEIRIWDYGQPFNLEEWLKQKSIPDDEDIGGRGLLLLQKIADFLSYTPVSERGNCLLILKNYPSQ